MIDGILRQVVHGLTSPRLLGGSAAVRDLGRTGMRLADCRSVLVVRFDEIGDMVLTSPLMRELRRALPQAAITLMVRPRVLNLVERCPHVDRVVAYDVPPVSGARREIQRHLEIRRSVRQLIGRPPDLAILPRLDFDLAGASLAAFYSRAPRRAGFTEHAVPAKQRLNRGYDHLLTDVLRGDGAMHEVERNLSVLRQLGLAVGGARLELWLSPEDRHAAQAALAPLSGGSARIAVCPGAALNRKRWAVEHFCQTFLKMLAADPNLRFVLVGGPGEESLGAQIARDLGPVCVDLIGKLTIRQTAAALEECQLYLGNDTGPMHLAAAAGVPVVMLSSFPRDGDPMQNYAPQRFGPWGVPNAILQPEHAQYPCIGICSAAEAHCINQISAENVARSALDLLKSQP